MKITRKPFGLSAYAYRLFGKRVEKLQPHFKDLKIQMKSGGVRIAFPAYLSYMFLLSALAFIVPIASLPFLLPFILNINLLSLQNILLSLLIASASSILTFIVLYSYPKIKSNHRRTPIDNNLPYISTFLTLLSSSNVAPKQILDSIAYIPTLSEVRQEFSNILRDIEIFGQDLLTSISENVKYIPSTGLQEILSGYVATIKTGGNPTDYLEMTTDKIMKERMLKLDSALESLAALAEIYIMILVAMPLLFVVLFATLGMLGGVNTMNPVLMLNLLTYLGIPAMAAALMVIVDSNAVR